MVASGKHALVSAFLAKHYGGVVGHDPRRALGTVTAKDHHGTVEATPAPVIVRHCQNGSRGTHAAPVDRPLGTVCSKAEHSVVSATLVGVGGRAGQSPPCACDDPLNTTTAKADRAIAAANLIRMNHGDKQWNSVDEPLRTITSQGNKAGLVLAFLQKYYGNESTGHGIDAPLGTVTTRDRFGVVTVEVEPGNVVEAASVMVKGERYLIADIGLRMLSPRELARCQGFPDSYVLTGSQANQVAKIGNSVPPQVVEALVRANLGEVAA